MSAGLPEDFELSRPRREDAAEVAALIAEMELAQEGEAETTPADIVCEWETTDTDRDVWLVRERGRLVGYGALERHPRGVVTDGFVHPDSTGRGIGRFLVRSLEARAGELESEGMVQTGVSLRDTAGQMLLESEGYRAARRFMRMIVELTKPPIVPATPGVEIRNLVSGEERAFHAVFERSFSGAWGHVERTFEDWWLRMTEVGSGDPAMLFVADRSGELVGEASCIPERFGGGWVGTLGVLPESRGQGIGKALLQRAFASFWERDERRVALAVDAENDTGAAQLYESVGMRVAFGAITYEKPLGTGTVGT
jgi:GNAT superfamily N-acetyltransferase